MKYKKIVLYSTSVGGEWWVFGLVRVSISHLCVGPERVLLPLYEKLARTDAFTSTLSIKNGIET